MSTVSPIHGVTLAQYAELCAAMADTGGDEARELVIAAEAGLSADAWRAAKAGFTARMQDPADQGRTATAFMPLYQAAQAARRGGGPPCSLETYAVISTSYSYEQDPQGNKVKPAVIFARHGISAAQWNEFTGYWTPKVNDPADPAAAEFRVLVQRESDRIFGIHRDASGSRVDADDEEASPADRAAARAALAAARRPVEQAAPRPVGKAPAPARPESRPAPVAARGQASADPGATPPGQQSSEERMWAAGAHACVALGFAGFGPLVIWFLFRDPDKSRFVEHRALQAAVVQGAAVVLIIGLSILTCGMGSALLFPWMLFELWIAWQTWNGKVAGYPGLPAYDGGPPRLWGQRG